MSSQNYHSHNNDEEIEVVVAAAAAAHQEGRSDTHSSLVMVGESIPSNSDEFHHDDDGDDDDDRRPLSPRDGGGCTPTTAPTTSASASTTTDADGSSGSFHDRRNPYSSVTHPMAGAASAAAPPPPPPPPRVSIVASSPTTTVSSSTRSRRSTLRTVHSGRSLHSQESKSDLFRNSKAQRAAAAAAAATTTTTASGATTPSIGTSASNSNSNSSPTSKKPPYRKFLQRTHAVRPRYNPNRGHNNNNNNGGSSGVATADPNNDSSSGSAGGGHGGGTGGGHGHGAANHNHHQQQQQQQQQQYHNTHANNHTSNSKAALLASRLARRGQAFNIRRLGHNKGDEQDHHHGGSGVSGVGAGSAGVDSVGPLMGSAGGGGGSGSGSVGHVMMGGSGIAGGGLQQQQRAHPPTTTPAPGHIHRQHKMGDKVLVCNHQSRWANLVNRHGFPPGEGATPDERRGPYMYVLAEVKSVHFEEYSVYYTVVRADTGAEQRADADFMEPLTSPRGQAAALRAATKPLEHDSLMNPQDFVPQRGDSRGKCMAYIEEVCFVLLCPFFWLWDGLRFVFLSYICPLGMVAKQFLTRQARLFLNGLEPYSCRLRITMVNFCVVCSTWYMFIDQARLAFFSPSADFALAIVNFFVWLFLIMELFCEVFIRADNYGELIVSEKAYAPTTVRYINSFHLVVESISLACFLPEFYCLFSGKYACDDRIPFSFFNAALMSVTGPTQLEAFYGKAFFALIRLRVFGLVRHWKTMWIVNTFIHMKWKANKGGLISNIIPTRGSMTNRKSTIGSNQNGGAIGADAMSSDANNSDALDEAALTSASTIGTALMVTNSYRALAILWVITGVFPMISCIMYSKVNNIAPKMTEQLQATNLISNDTSNTTCEFLFDSIISWTKAVRAPDVVDDPTDPFLLGLQVEPRRCFGVADDILDRYCQPVLAAAETEDFRSYTQSKLIAWEICKDYNRTEGSSGTEIAHELGLRAGSILQFYREDEARLYTQNVAVGFLTNFSVLSTFDETYTVKMAAMQSFLLQLVLLVSVLGGLSVLRRDAEVLVLGPLRRMLKIVARYAKNPLMPTKFKRRMRTRHSRYSQRTSNSRGSDASSYSSSDDSEDDFWGNDDALGSYETEQLITAVTKITDLLRKCWGVAGADIISTNLDSQEGLKQVFNPTVAGKKVYALFAFAAITDFAHAQRNLGDNVMILINHVAAVVHDEVFRWGFGDSGACNKNLGAAFLLVFRIGLVSEVQKKLNQAKDVLFSHGPKASQAAKRPKKTSIPTDSTRTTSSTVSYASMSAHNKKTSSMRHMGGGGKSPSHGRHGKAAIASTKRAASEKAMSLASLPGIHAFTDRAVIGMLKSFAGIHRDKKIRDWNNSFELSAGVGTFTVSMIYGMDAGWAMEGAVGSEYKIDATYLSPHVNMASRMMSACKQYGVSILLSQAVQELMSDVARSKLRHLDTVTVKGSSMKQKIYTYDARHQGVDFFLYSKTDAQADEEANKYYDTKIWNIDQDLKAMRQHVTEDFLKEFASGRKAYLAGDWPVAIKRLERANEIMVETALEEGYLEDEFHAFQQRAGEDARAAAEELKVKNGDGPSLYLLNFMKSHGGIAPDRWEGWHPLMRK